MKNKKKIALFGVLVFFCVIWMIYHLGPTYAMKDDMTRLKDILENGAGYFCVRVYTSIYIVPFLLFIIGNMTGEDSYRVIRYGERDKIWVKSLLELFKNVFIFVFLHFLVNFIFMYFRFPWELIVESDVLIYILKFSPIVFLYYFIAGTIFMIIKTKISMWRALIVVFASSVFLYFLFENDILRFFVSYFCTIGELKEGKMDDLQVLLNYLKLFFSACIVVILGFKFYRRKEFLENEK